MEINFVLHKIIGTNSLTLCEALGHAQINKNMKKQDWQFLVVGIIMVFAIVRCEIKERQLQAAILDLSDMETRAIRAEQGRDSCIISLLPTDRGVSVRKMYQRLNKKAK